MGEGSHKVVKSTAQVNSMFFKVLCTSDSKSLMRGDAKNDNSAFKISRFDSWVGETLMSEEVCSST